MKFAVFVNDMMNCMCSPAHRKVGTVNLESVSATREQRETVKPQAMSDIQEPAESDVDMSFTDLIHTLAEKSET